MLRRGVLPSLRRRLSTMAERYKYYTDSQIWRTGRKVVRTLRVVGACGTLYGVGYSAGIANALEDPESATRSLLMQVLTEQCGGAAVLDQSDRRSQLVIRIGGELLAAAHEHLEQAAHEARDAAEREGHVAKLRALQRHHWRFVVIDNDTVNAFVCDLLPGFVFVHRGLLELFESSEDEASSHPPLTVPSTPRRKPRLARRAPPRLTDCVHHRPRARPLPRQPRRRDAHSHRHLLRAADRCACGCRPYRCAPISSAPNESLTNHVAERGA